MANSEAPYLNVAKPIGADSVILTAPTELTIASGVITVTQGYHTVDTEADGASDNLDTISGLAVGESAVLFAENAGRTVVVKHATGNIHCPGGTDISLAEVTDCVTVLRHGAAVIVTGKRTLA